MQLKRFIDDDEAVSPVIGVILMVAITVILAAVIATFVLGLGEQISDTGPTVSFDFDYDEGSGSPAALTITHSNGQTIEAGNLYLRGSEASGTQTGSWDAIDGSSYGATSEVNAGSSITIDVEADDTVRVVWESDSGGQSKTLESWRGPDA
jgi:flagellin-like protein